MRAWIGVWDASYPWDYAVDSRADCRGGLLPTNYMLPAGAANLGNPTPLRSPELGQGRREKGTELSELGPRISHVHART